MVTLFYSAASLRARCLIFCPCPELRLPAAAGLPKLSWPHSASVAQCSHLRAAMLPGPAVPSEEGEDGGSRTVVRSIHPS